jgi:hypothetical protein
MKKLLSTVVLFVTAGPAFGWNEPGYALVPGKASRFQIGKAGTTLAQSIADQLLVDLRAKQTKAISQIRSLGGEVVTENEVAGGTAAANAFHAVICVDLRRAIVSDTELALLTRFPGLVSLDLSSTAITGAGLVHIRNLKRIRGLNLGRTAIDDLGLVHISELTELKSLCLDETKITDGGLACLQKMRDLEDILDLSETQISDVGLRQVEHCKKLKHINLRGTLVTEEGKNRLRAALPQVRVFP